MIETERSAEQQRATEATVERLLEGVKHLSTLPQAAVQVMRLVEDPESTAGDFQRVISTDPALSARIIKVVNSSYYGVSRQVDSIQEAVVLVGLKVVNSIAVAGSFHKFVEVESVTGNFEPAELWNHSIAVATIATNIANLNGDGAYSEQAFLAGLIHDLGIIVELQTCPEFPSMLAALDADASLTFREAEQQWLGVTHEDFGAGLCRKWNFPPTLEAVTGFHHRPLQAPAEYQTLPAIVHLADVLAAELGVGYTGTIETETVDPEVLSLLGICDVDLDRLRDKVPDKIERTINLLAASE